MLNLNSNIELDFKIFWRWWMRELSFLIPEKIRHWVSEQHGYLLLSPTHPNLLTLTYVDESNARFIAHLERNDLGIAQFKKILADNEPFSKAKAILRLSGQEAIQRELLLPVAAKENLRQVVAYELDKYTPFTAEQVYFAVKISENDSKDTGFINVKVSVSPKEVVDALCEDISAMGIALVYMDYQDTLTHDIHLDNKANLLPEHFRHKVANTPRLIHAGLISVVCCLLVMVMVVPLWFNYQTVAKLTDKINTIEKEAKKIKALQADIDSVIDKTQKLIDEKNASPMMVDILNTLSTLIDDRTWLAYLQYSEHHLQIQGESPSASTLIGVLESNDIFTKARFVSPVTQNNINKLERFQITVDTTKKGGEHVEEHP
jgi:general secretion pathway protein L